MKQFTFNDLIQYNNPCIECGNGTKIQLILTKKDIKDRFTARTLINPEIVKDKKVALKYALKTNYNSKLYLIISPIYNHYNIKLEYKKNYTSEKMNDDIVEFKKLLEDHIISARINCTRCQTWTETNPLEFKGEYIKPMTLCKEVLIVSYESQVYYLGSSFKHDSTTLHFGRANNNEKLMWNNDFTAKWDAVSYDAVSKISKVDLPLLPRFAFKDKEHMIKKLQIYTLFS